MFLLPFPSTKIFEFTRVKIVIEIDAICGSDMSRTTIRVTIDPWNINFFTKLRNLASESYISCPSDVACICCKAVCLAISSFVKYMLEHLQESPNGLVNII